MNEENTTICKYCGMKIPKTALKSCPECKTDFNTGKSKADSLKNISIVTLFIIFLLIIIAFSSKDTRNYIDGFIYYVKEGLSKIF